MKNLLSKFRQFFTRVLNKVVPSETLEASKAKWNRLAGENARYYVLTNYGPKIKEQEFRAEGEADVVRYVDEDPLMRSELEPFKTKKVLEIGCGIGRLSEFLANRFREVVGIDISEEMIIRAQERLQKHNLSFVATDGTAYPFEDNSFDFVFSFITFQHMPDEATVQKNITEIARILRPGGVAKIQLRGIPVKKTEWFYGPSFDSEKVRRMTTHLPLQIIAEEGEGEKYYWITFKKN